MKTTRIDSANYKFNKDIPPVASVPSGTHLTFASPDCFGGQITRENYENALDGEFDWDRVNPTAGPVAILGAEPGDVLRVEILDITPTGDGVLMTGKGLGVCQDDFDKLETRVVEMRDNHVLFSDNIKIPMRPMIGVIGVAPAGEPVNNGFPGDHGGNLDCKKIGAGAVVYLPVYVDGGLLSLGDVHGLQADGEVGGTGAECPAEVQVKVELLKNCKRPTPFVENDTHYMPVASAQTMDEAISNVVKNGVDFLMQEFAMSRFDALTFCSLAADVRICQVVDPLMTARLEIPKQLLR